MKKMVFLLLGFLVVTFCLAGSGNTENLTDSAGRKIIKGPLRDPYKLDNVHIISDSYGIITKIPLKLYNSVIEAQTCIKSTGDGGLDLEYNNFDCNLVIEFSYPIQLGNTFINNKYTGRFSNIE